MIAQQPNGWLVQEAGKQTRRVHKRVINGLIRHTVKCLRETTHNKSFWVQVERKGAGKREMNCLPEFDHSPVIKILLINYICCNIFLSSFPFRTALGK